MQKRFQTTCFGSIEQPQWWLFDMDDTLYGASRGMFDEILLRMLHFVMQHLHLNQSDADALRIHYWKTYGVTYYGLWLHHGIDPHRFLQETHNVNISIIKARPQLSKTLHQLPGQKALFTNAPEHFAKRVLEQLRISGCFKRKICAEQMRFNTQWHPKPSSLMLQHVLTQLNIPAFQVCLIDDNPNNLKAAKQIGMQTILFQGWHRQDPSKLPKSPWIDASICSFTELPKIIRSPSVGNTCVMSAPKFLNPFA